MNSAVYVDALIINLQKQVDDGYISRSEAIWKTGLACQGWAYVFGAWGAYCTPGERKQRYKYHNIASILEKCQRLRSSDPKGTCSGCKWYPNGEKTRCFDCRGFSDWLLKMFGFDLEGEGATGQWNSKKNWCIKGDDMSAIPQGVIVNVFIWDSTNKNMKHTGIYYNGDTLECSNGVQLTSPMKKNRWTHWAVAKCFEKDMQNSPVEPPKTPVNEPAKENPSMSYKTIRRGNYGELVKQLQTKLQALGYNLGICGVDGDFGQATEKAVKAFQKAAGLTQDGVVGKNTWAALEQAVNAQQTAPKVTYYTVTIPHQTDTEADAIIAKYPNAKKEKEG